MKRTLTLMIAVAPTLLSASTETQNVADFGQISSMLIVFSFFLLVVIALLLIFREVICWYFKINKMHKQQQEILHLLKELKEKQ
jgi:Na+/melibiose symporter-like transporter